MIRSTLQYLNSLIIGLTGIVFPNVCVCCGLEVPEQEQLICSFCLLERFKDANPDHKMQSTAELLPEGVTAQHALWQFDKGGVLQDLMHQLKYEQLTGAGRQMGHQLANRTLKHPRLAELLRRYGEHAIIVPVPLHYLKQVKRGYNQARVIAEGLQEQLDTPVSLSAADDVVRRKNTKSQTGFSLQQRNANMKNAFIVENPARFSQKLAVVVDDVFTTGATSFELAGELLSAGASEVIILTIAQA